MLTKADLCDDVDGAVAEVEAVAFGVPVHAVSSVTGEGIDELRAVLRRRPHGRGCSARRASASRR